MLFRYFQELCLLAEEDVGPLGFVVGFQSTSSRLAFFLWQIGVDPSARGKGVATDLVRAAVANAKILGCVALECTITNKSSYRVFEKVAQDEGSKLVKLGVVDFVDPISNQADSEELFRLPFRNVG